MKNKTFELWLEEKKNALRHLSIFKNVVMDVTFTINETPFCQ